MLARFLRVQVCGSEIRQPSFSGFQIRNAVKAAPTKEAKSEKIQKCESNIILVSRFGLEENTANFRIRRNAAQLPRERKRYSVRLSVDGGIKAQQIGRQKNFAYQKERAAGYGSPFLLVF